MLREAKSGSGAESVLASAMELAFEIALHWVHSIPCVTPLILIVNRELMTCVANLNYLGLVTVCPDTVI